MDNNSPSVQATYRTSGVDSSSSAAAGRAEASLGYQQPAGQQHNESHSDWQNRVTAFNGAKQSSGN